MAVDHPFWGMTKTWAQVWEALEVARGHSAVGNHAPPLARLGRLVRPLARLAARALVFAAGPFTRPQRQFNVIDMATAWKADLIVRKARPFSVEEMRRRVEGDLLGAKVFVASAEDTLISKLECGPRTYPDCDGDAVSPLITLTPSTLITASARSLPLLRMRIPYSLPGLPIT